MIGSTCRIAAGLLAVVAIGSPLGAQAPLGLRTDDEPVSHDALHYDAWIRLADSGTRIRAAVTTRWRVSGGDPIRIDLHPRYTVDTLLVDGKPAGHRREGVEILVPLDGSGERQVETRIVYAGSPPPFPGRGRDDGLVQEGRGASRRIFADNWPDRARKWLASQDHPSDKATIDWTIDAPAALTVVANGVLKGTERLGGGLKRWRFSVAQPIPTYTMVIGAARLAVTELKPACAVRCVPVSVITYPEDSAWAVNGPFRRASEIVDFYSKLIAPFPYDVLRHVETSTIFGGVENSTVIFYDEQGYRSRTLSEGTVAHETVHQWFGDAATERDWHHLWLSEGFATYGAVLWEEHLGGEQARASEMAAHKATVLAAAVTERPILDTTITEFLRLLNSNNYPKGAWVLHTLRGLVGDSTFFRGLRRYYREFEHRTALSGDFARIMSDEAGADLGWYFEQALTRPGYPIVRVRSRVAAGHATITLEQVQKPEWGLFRLPNLEIGVAGRTIAVPLVERSAQTVFHWERSTPPEVVVDPRGWWLLAVESQRAR